MRFTMSFCIFEGNTDSLPVQRGDLDAALQARERTQLPRHEGREPDGAEDHKT